MPPTPPQPTLAPTPPPPEPPHAADERTMLTAFLDYYRAVLLRKVEGAPLDEAARTRTPTGMSLLGILKHMVGVECWWFRDALGGEDPEYLVPERVLRVDRDADWRIEPDDTVESICAAFRAEVEHSRRVAASMELDDVARKEGRDETLRWVLLHMLEETARHAGHADLMREDIDGATGD